MCVWEYKIKTQYKKSFKYCKAHIGPSSQTSLIVIPCNTFHFLSIKTIYVKYDGKKSEQKNKSRSSWMVLVTLTPCQWWWSSKGRRVLRIQCIKKYKMHCTGCQQNFEGNVGRSYFGAKVAQCRPMSPILAQTVQDNLDGSKWSKKLVSQHCSKKSATFLGHPVDTYKVHKVFTRSAASAQREPVMSPSPPFGHRSLIGSFGSVDSKLL